MTTLSAINKLPVMSDHKVAYEHVLFISDVKLSDKIKTDLSGDFKEVIPWRVDFLNRSCQDIQKAGITHIWCDISNSKARGWLEEVIQDREPYKACLVYKGSSDNLFVHELRPICDTTVKLKDLTKLMSLSFEELLHKAEKLVKIHAPASCLSCIGIGNNTKKNE